MKNIFLIVITLSISQIVFGQKNISDTVPPKVQTKAQIEAERKNHDCVHKMNKSFTNRLKNYPFNEASQIKLVSFSQLSDKIDTNEQNKFAELPGLNDTINYLKLYEIRSLLIREVDKLTDILYNIGFRGKTLTEGEISCYEPRNAVLFIDKNGKTFEYIELCFNCEKAVVSSDKISIGDICKTKFSLIKNFFRSMGIDHGTNNKE